MKRLTVFTNKLFEGMPEGGETEKVKEEIIRDLEEKVSDLIEEGKTEEDAINKVIVEFGDIEEIKREMDLPQTPKDRKQELARLNFGFSLWGSCLIVALVVFVNFYYTPHVIWFIYPSFGIAWWPLSMFYHLHRKKLENRS
ncbi:permease prefix domain 1-containing protein [Sporolactobacillus shoreicorticis]|uniref:Permease prefix domain 1-containing protein n=1 Tax=Sporolactobacillus shoreicorticis TaxID=1923877 RepID=A0ABW5S1V9_9BACL|nr:permease prefix domain 1-containing protein [Sporolactobacillus shoreicorticis]MCO7127009.1 permease prefix domain 1-containing protein [Sporolactobacillus shoreicorticis]